MKRIISLVLVFVMFCSMLTTVTSAGSVNRFYWEETRDGKNVTLKLVMETSETLMSASGTHDLTVAYESCDSITFTQLASNIFNVNSTQKVVSWSVTDIDGVTGRVELGTITFENVKSTFILPEKRAYTAKNDQKISVIDLFTNDAVDYTVYAGKKIGLIYENDGTSGWKEGYDFINNENQKVDISYLVEEDRNYMHFVPSGSVSDVTDYLSTPMAYASLGDNKIVFEEGYTIVTEMMIRTEVADATSGRARVGYSFPEDKSLAEFTYINDQTVTATAQTQTQYTPNICSEVLLEFFHGMEDLDVRYGLGTYPKQYTNIEQGKWFKIIIKIDGNHNTDYTLIDPITGSLIDNFRGQRQIKPESGCFENVALYTWMNDGTLTNAYTDIDYIKVYNIPDAYVDNYQDITGSYDEGEITNIKVDGVPIEEVDEATDGTVTFDSETHVTVKEIYYEKEGEKVQVTDFNYADNTVTFNEALVKNADYTVVLALYGAIETPVKFKSGWQNPTGLIINYDGTETDKWVSATGKTVNIDAATDEDGTTYTKMTPDAANSYMYTELPGDGIKYKEDEKIVIDTRVRGNNMNSTNDARLQIKWNLPASSNALLKLRYNGTEDLTGKTTISGNVENGFTTTYRAEGNHLALAEVAKTWSRFSNGRQLENDTAWQTNWQTFTISEGTYNKWYRIVIEMEYGFNMKYKLYDDADKLLFETTGKVAWIEQSEFLKNIAVMSFRNMMDSADIDYLKVYNLSAGDDITNIYPKNLTVENITGSTVELSWEKTNDIFETTKYEIYRNNDKINETSELVYKDIDLETNTQYVYYVVAVDSEGNRSEPSQSVVAIPVMPKINRIQPDTGSMISKGTKEIYLYANNLNNIKNSELSVKYRIDKNEWNVLDENNIKLNEITDEEYVYVITVDTENRELANYEFEFILSDEAGNVDTYSAIYGIGIETPSINMSLNKNESMGENEFYLDIGYNLTDEDLYYKNLKNSRFVGCFQLDIVYKNEKIELYDIEESESIADCGNAVFNVNYASNIARLGYVYSNIRESAIPENFNHTYRVYGTVLEGEPTDISKEDFSITNSFIEISELVSGTISERKCYSYDYEGYSTASKLNYYFINNINNNIDNIKVYPEIQSVSPQSGNSIGGTENTLNLYISKIDDVEDYELIVKYRKAGGEWRNIPSEDINAEKTTYFQRYKYTININMDGQESGEYEFNFKITNNKDITDEFSAIYDIDCQAPAKVNNFVATAGEANVLLSWEMGNEIDIAKYIIYRSVDGSSFEKYKEISGRDNTYVTDSSVTIGTKYYYKISAMDGYNQEGILSDAVEVTPQKDTTVPSIMSISPSQGTVLTGAKTITVKASDNLGVSSVELQYSTDNGTTYKTLGTKNNAATVSFSFDSTKVTDGTVQVRAIATDKSGNVSDGQPVYTYIVDNTGPNKISDFKLNSKTYTTITLEWASIEDGDYSYCVVEKKSGTSWVNCAKTTTVLGANITGLSPETEYTFRVVAYDKYGNRGEASDEVTVKTDADNEAPVITSINPKPASFSNSIAVQLTAKDSYKVKKLEIETSADAKNWVKETIIELDTPVSSKTFSYTLSLADKSEGILYVRGIAEDVYGNRSNSSETAPYVQYNVDKTAPTTPTDVELICYGGYLELKWTQGTDSDLKGYNVYRSTSKDSGYSKVASSITKVNYIDSNVLSGRMYYYKVQAIDTAGNIGEFSEVVSGEMLADTEAPVIKSWNYSNGVTIQKTNTLNILATDNNLLSKMTLEYKTDETDWTVLETKTGNQNSYIFKFAVTSLADGTYSFRAKTTDASGNESNYSNEMTYTFDSTAPKINEVTVTPNEGSITVKWTGNAEQDLAGYYIYRKTTGSYSKVASYSNSGKTSYEFTDTNVSYGTNYTYRIETFDSVGNKNTHTTSAVMPLYVYVEPAPDTTKPNISCTIPSTMQQAVEEYFDATRSTDDTEISSYHWDFGDGATSSKAKSIHSYSELGRYTVTLTVTDTSGNTSTASKTITVVEKKMAGTLKIKVVDDSGNKVSGAGVFYKLGAEDMVSYATNANGEVTITDYSGTYDIGVYADGYLPAKQSVSIVNNADNSLTIRIIKKEIIVGELTYTRMTFAEIVAAGIDPDAPENQYVYKYEINLTFGTSSYKGTAIKSQGTSNVQPVKITNWTQTSGTASDTTLKGGYVWIVGDDSNNDDYNQTYTSSAKQIVAVLEVPGEASWLKEFFDVQLHIHNQAEASFVIEDCVAKLNYPANGLTLMTDLAEGYSETQTVNIGSIAGQEHKYINWVLRGEKPGEYDISADFSGRLRDFNEEIKARFECSEPIEVYGSENLFLDIWVEDSIAPDADSAIRVGLTNEGLVDVYMPKISLDDLELIRRFKTDNGVIVKTDYDVLTPGETIWVDYRIPRSINETLKNLSDKEVYLYSAVVNAIGGNAKLQHRFEIVPAYTISPDIINVYKKDSTGELQPLNIIETSRGLSTEIPDIVIETLTLDENMQFVPASRQITIEDEHLIKKGKDLEEVYGKESLSADADKFVVNTGSDGLFTLKGYDIDFVLKTMKPFNITISSPRAVSKQIPVVMRDSASETTVVEGHVYYKGKGTQSPLFGAEVTIGDKVTTTDEEGRFYFDAIGIGKNNITIKKDGYEEINELLTVKENERVDYYLNKIIDSSAPHIKSVENTMFTTKNGNATVIPEEKIEGYIQFSITSELKGESFLKHKYYIIDESGKIVSTGDIPAYIFSYNLKDLKVGQQLMFSLVTIDKDGKEKESPMYDTNIIIAEAPNFLEKIVLSLNDMDGLGKFKEFNILNDKLPVSFTTESQKIIQQSLFESTWINTEDEDVKKASYLLEGLRLDSKTKTEFPLKAEYNLDGTFKISFGAKVTQKPQNLAYYRSVGDYLSYSNDNLYYESSSSYTETGIFDLSSLSEGKNKKLNIGGDAVLDLTMKYDPGRRDWKCVLGITISGHAKADVFKVQVPVAWGIAGGYADVAVGGSAEARWEPIVTYLSDIIDLADISLDILPAKLKGGIEVKGGVGIYAIDSDVISGGFYAKLKADIHMIPQQKLLFGYDFGAEGKVVIWKPSKSLLSDKFEIRLFESEPVSTMRLMSLMDTEEKTMSISSADHNSQWNGEDIKLKQNVFDGSKPQLHKLDSERVLMVFADYDTNRNVDNPVQMMYSIYSDNVWSAPQPIYDDGTIDLYPQLTSDTDGNIYATWIDFNQALFDVSEITISKLRESIYPKMTVETAVFNPTTNKWSIPQVVSTGEFFKKSPQIATNGKTTASVWVQNKANYEYGTSNYKDTIGYSISGSYNSSGELEVDTASITSIATAVYQDTVYLLYTKAVKGVMKAYFRKYNGTWSEEFSINENAYEDKCLRTVIVNGEIYVYYINNNKVYRYDISSDESECVVYDESINGLLDFEVIDDENVIWIANYKGQTEVFMTCKDGDTITTIMLDLRSFDGMLQKISAVNANDCFVVSSIESIYGDEVSNVLSAHVLSKQINLMVEEVNSDNSFIPGIQNTFTIKVKNKGLIKSEGFKVYCSPSKSIDDAFGEPYEYTNYLEAGRSVSVIASANLPSEYNESYVYFLIEDSNGSITSQRENIVYDNVRIGEIKKESSIPGKMNFIVDIDNYGYVNHDGLILRINNGSTEETISEISIEKLPSNTSRKITLYADLDVTDSTLYTIEVVSKNDEILDDQIVEITDSDYKILLGDYFCDGIVNSDDATALLQRMAYDETDSERQHLSGDINENNRIEPNDVTAILQYCAELISNFK